MKNVSDKSCRKKHNKILFSSFFEIMWKNIAVLERPQVTILRMRIACQIHTATNTLKLYNTRCFSIATIVVRTRLCVTSCVHYVSVLLRFILQKTPISYCYRVFLNGFESTFSLIYLYHQSNPDYKYTYVTSTKWQYRTWLDEQYSSEYPQISSTSTLFMEIWLASLVV
jgi:hypothetical protein